MIKRMIVAVAVLFAILLLMLPKTDDASKKKMASAAMLMCSSDFRKEVAQQVLAEGEVDQTFNNKCPELIASLSADEAGVVTLHGAKHGVTMVLTPQVVQGEVRWSCHGEPRETLTKLCKP